MEENDKIDLSKYMSAIKKGRLLYLATFVVLVSLSILYHFIRTDQYQAYSCMLIEDDDGDSGSAMKGLGSGMQSVMRTFSIGGMGSSSIDNEIEIFKTRNSLIKMIKTLQLNRNYIEKRGLKKYNLYKESPIIVEAPEELFDTLSVGYVVNVHLYTNGKADIKAVKGIFAHTLAEKEGVTLPASITTDYGTLQILKSDKYDTDREREIKVYISGNELVAEYYSKLITIDYLSKKSDGVELYMNAPSKQLGEDILNTLMSTYNNIRQDRKNDRAQQALEFYDGQIAELSKLLNESEKRVEDFKNTNNLIDVESEARMSISADKEFEARLAEMYNEIMLQDIIINFLNRGRIITNCFQ